MSYKNMSEEKKEEIRQNLMSGGYPEYWLELSDQMKEDVDYICELCSDDKREGINNFIIYS